MDRIIEVKVTGHYLTKDNNLAGVQGEANAAALRIGFDESWDGFAKTITWWNAHGGYGTARMLTVDLLDDISADTHTYLAPIPGEALTVPGKCTFAIDGYAEGKRQRSVYGSLLVKDNGSNEDDPAPEVTPTVAEQLQSELEYIAGNIRDAIESREDAARSAVEAADSARGAEISAQDAWESASEAEQSAGNAENQAALSRSWAVGGTGTREDEDRDNARYWCERAEVIAGGDFVTKSDLKTEADTRAKTDLSNVAQDTLWKTAVRAGMTAFFVGVTLSADGWVQGENGQYTQTVEAEGIVPDASAQMIFAAPDPSVAVQADQAGVLCSGQGENILTFTADVLPEQELGINVFYQNVEEKTKQEAGEEG